MGGTILNQSVTSFDIEERCQALLTSFGNLALSPEGSKERCAPLTPNDPATIALLASEVLCLRAAAKLALERCPFPVGAMKAKEALQCALSTERR